MLPLVIVKSFGSENSLYIIKQTARFGGQENLQILPASQTPQITTYVCNIITKYYKTEIGLFAFDDDDLEAVPADLFDSIEAALFYIDGNDISWHSKAKSICEFVKKSNINTAALITHHLDENQLVDVMMELKTYYESLNFDIIDLSAQNDNDDDDDAIDRIEKLAAADKDNSNQYSEVYDFLKNTIWSNVEYPEPVDLDENLNNFEDLLNKVKVFKATSEFLSRSELLNQAEKLAELFANIIDEDDTIDVNTTELN